MEKKLKDIYDSINYTSNNIDKLNKEIKEHKSKSGVVGCFILVPLTFGFSSIGAGFYAYEKNKIEKQIKEYEKVLENYRIKIEKLRAKEEAIKLFDNINIWNKYN